MDIGYVLLKWEKNETEFEMNMIDDQKQSRFVRILHPLAKFLEISNTLKFIIKGRTMLIIVRGK